MKITDVEAIHLRLLNIAETADGTQDVLLVRVSTDEGVSGIGEVSSQSYVAKAIIEAPRSATCRHGLAEIVRGHDPRDTEAMWRLMYEQTRRYGRRGIALHTISAVDLALWDIRGKLAGKAVYELLGGKRRDTVRAYASYLFGDTPEETAKLAQEAVGLGLTAVKFGWNGFGKDEATDLAHVEAARSVIGPDRDLMIDAGLAWDWRTALQRAHLFAPFKPMWLEEPIAQDDRVGYTKLCAESPIPIAAGEGDVTPFDFEDLIDRGVHVIQPDVAFCGGMTVARRVAQMAQAAGKRCVPHCFSTGVNLAASLHWMAADPNGDLVEYCLSPSPLMRKLVSNLPALRDGHITVPAGTGLDVKLDEDIVNRYRVRYD